MLTSKLIMRIQCMQIKKYDMKFFIFFLFIFSIYIISNTLVFAVSEHKDATAGSLEEDGPYTICSDQFSYQGSTHKIVYEGNVQIMQIKGMKLSCHGVDMEIEKDKQATLVNNLQYQDYVSRSLLAYDHAKDICEVQGRCRYMSGDKLTILLNAQNQIKTMKMIIVPTKNGLDARVMYYAKEPSEDASKSKNMQDKTDIITTYASGNEILDKMNDNMMYILTNAKMHRNGDDFEGDQVNYNTKTNVIIVPNTGQRASMVLNNDTFNG